LVHKLGHFGYVHREFDSELKWYTDNFNFVPSDILYHRDFSKIDVMTFMHLDRGHEYTDHHIFFMQRAPPEVKKTYLHHSSYEVEDFDTQLIGHQWLAKQGWKSVWGVGGMSWAARSSTTGKTTVASRSSIMPMVTSSTEIRLRSVTWSDHCQSGALRFRKISVRTRLFCWYKSFSLYIASHNSTCGEWFSEFSPVLLELR
jgi:hypothetical protein